MILRRATLLCACLALAACTPDRPLAVEPDLVLGVGSTDEQRMLAALALVVLDAEGLVVEPRLDLGSTVDLREEAERGDIDLWWDYTGAAWSLGLELSGTFADPVESYEAVRAEDAEHGFVWLPPTTANATLTFFVRPPVEDTTLDWLAEQVSVEGRALCADPDFFERRGGFADLAEGYAIEVGRVEQVPAGEAKAIAWTADGTCFAGLATATSGQAQRAGLVPLRDDLGYFPAFVVAPVATEVTVARLPELADHLAPVVERLTTATLASLNGRLRPDAPAEPIAAEFLADVVPLPTQ